MKEIIYNEDKLKDEEIHEWVKRAKVLVVNSKDELLLAHTDDSYYLLGGHVDGDESDNECLIREIREEAGILYDPKVSEPFISIKYYCKDYPQEGFNKGYISNYYVIYDDMEFNSDNVDLTDGEKAGNFRLVYIHRDNVIEEVKSYLDKCKRKNVLRDTIDVLEEFLRK